MNPKKAGIEIAATELEQLLNKVLSETSAEAQQIKKKIKKFSETGSRCHECLLSGGQSSS